MNRRMRLTLSVLFIIAAAAHSQTPPPDIERLIRLKDRASVLLANVPDYTCIETIARIERSAQGRRKSADVIRVAVAVVDQKETYGWPNGERFLDRQLSQMIPGGMRATGLYRTFVRGLMSARNDDIQFAGAEKLNGESVYRYDFQISASEGSWNIQVGQESGKAGERGSFWVEAKNLGLRRLEVRAVGIPSNIGLKDLHLFIDYDVMSIADRPVLLASKAWVDALEWTGKEDVSHVFFHHCRAFAADSTISFDAQPGSPTKSPSGNVELPAGLKITATLETALDTATASPGDPLAAAIAKAVFWKGKEIVSQGAHVEGHIRQLRPLPDLAQYAVTIEFDRIQTHDGWVQFYAKMTALGGAGGTPGKKGHAAFEAAPDVSGREMTDPDMPGIVTIYLPAASAQMPAGTSMTWRTEDLMAGKDSVSPNLNTRFPIN